MTKRIRIAFSANGEGQLTCDGLGTFPCLGQAGRQYPIDLTVGPNDREPEHESGEFPGVIMKWCILIWGDVGIYIHEGPDNLHDNDGATAGCIHLGVGNAKTVYDWIDERTRITISYPWRIGPLDVELWELIVRMRSVEHKLRGSAAVTDTRRRSIDQIVTSAREYAATQKVFAGGCSEMVRTAYAAGGITIPTSYTANDMLDNYPCQNNPQPGDIAGWKGEAGQSGHVVIYLEQNLYANCPGPGQATKFNTNMGHSLSYLRPT